MQNKKAVCIVLDGVGIGAAPDAHRYNDEGTNTLANTARVMGGLHLPNLSALGLGNIFDIQGVEKAEQPRASFGKMQEVSKGKDSTTGHWEICGIIMEKDFPYYPNGFPESVIEKFKKLTGCKGVLGNKVASGTAIIDELGDEHVRTGFPILYTSADSVFQIAAHEDVIPLERLYEICELSRHQIMVDEHAVGRVIARPFIGTSKNYKRTTNRRDFSLFPPKTTVLDLLFEKNIPTISIGKIDDLFAGKSLNIKIHTKSNAEGIEETIEQAKKNSNGFIFTNLVDFDQSYGHRQDPKGMKEALEYFDAQLPRILETIGENDILFITADHGNDPTDNSTDHSREYVPILAFSRKKKIGENIGTRSSFADLGNTIAEFFEVERSVIDGKSFLSVVC